MSNDRIDDLLTRAESHVESLAERDELSDSELLETIDDLIEVADEAEDLLDTVDLGELLAAIDLQHLPEAIKLENLPEAIADHDVEEAVDLRKLLQLTDLSQLLDSTDVRDAWQEADELDDEMDDLTDGKADDDGLLDREAMADAMDVDVDEHDGEYSELAEVAMQSKIDDAVGEFRESLIAAHKRLDRLREENQARTGSQDNQPSSANPTAYSSLAGPRTDMGTVGKHSTVPKTVRHSEAPARDRIYGDRFERWTDDG